MKSVFEQTIAQFSEVGYVEEVHSAVIRVSGLPGAHLEEVVLFENGAEGFIYGLEDVFIDVILINEGSTSIGERVARTGKPITIEISTAILGSALDALGKPLIYKAVKQSEKKIVREVFDKVPGIGARVPIKKPFHTGIAVVDITIPLGRGQRELVLGDRKTGKTQFLLQVLRNQVKTGAICIYCAIGKRESEIFELIEELKNPIYGSSVIVFASGGNEGVGRIYLTPFSAMATAEYFRDLGKDVFLILDDLSTHAQFYREMALLARRFPGRASYPGDIFHVHAELLERAGAFKIQSGAEATITCLPVAQSVFGDITGYITTNLMSMTDGHLYLDSEIFDEGRRPALNPFLSVTRVGHETQSSLMRDISREVTSFLITYRRAQEFSHFGSEVSIAVKDTLSRGKLLYTLFDQSSDILIPSHFAAFVVAHIWAGSFKNIDTDELKKRVVNGVTKFEDPAFKARFDAIFNSAPDFKTLITAVSQLPLP